MAQIFQKPILFFTNKIVAYSYTITQTDCWFSKRFLLHHCHKQKLFPPVFVSFLCQRFQALTVLTILLPGFLLMFPSVRIKMVQVKSGNISKISYNKRQKRWRFFISKQYDKQFKEDAVKYYLEHKELGLLKCAGNLGISKTALGTWTKAARENYGEVPVRCSGNYSSDEAKEIARLKRELRDTQDALEILKKAISILGN